MFWLAAASWNGSGQSRRTVRLYAAEWNFGGTEPYNYGYKPLLTGPGTR
ncbi:hypothetical protein ACFSL6_10810 [Paenibacillus thailandensis]|uniref:Uncharacterized protein n=1 Tax=Paenibacillus thailandensis TaxID=393250 RepID=A0ABW5R1U8_9BACL